MGEDTQKRWKAFPLIWAEIAEHNHEIDKFRPLTERQSAILLGAIEHYRWPTRWIGLELTPKELEIEIAEIKDRLMREADGMPDPIDTYEAIRDGIYDAANRIAAQIVSGRYTNIQIGEDGTVTDPTEGSGDASLPEDDPATAINETQAAKGGGVVGVRLGINTIWANMTTWYNAGVSSSLAEIRLSQLYQLDPTGLNDLVTTYWADRLAASPSVPATGFPATLEPYLYCKGVTSQSVAEWIYEVQTTNIVDQSSRIIQALTPAQLDVWFSKGAEVPSTLYLDYSCVPSPTEIMFLPVLGTAYTTQTSWKPNHILEITEEGYALDGGDGDIKDGWWYKTTAGTPVFVGAAKSMQLGTGITKPTTNQVPYSATHKYVYTIQTPAASGQLQVTIPATSMGSISYPTPLKITIVDKGEVVN